MITQRQSIYIESLRDELLRKLQTNGLWGILSSVVVMKSVHALRRGIFTPHDLKQVVGALERWELITMEQAEEYRARASRCGLSIELGGRHEK